MLARTMVEVHVEAKQIDHSLDLDCAFRRRPSSSGNNLASAETF